MRYRSLLIPFVLLGMVLCVGTVNAQERQEVSGTVTSADDNAPLPGANVSVPGTTIGTAANAQGQYSLEVPTDADSLRFSFVGFQAQTVAIAGRTTIDVALAPAAQQIEELVVVGYGQQKTEEITGSISKIDSAGFNPGTYAGPEGMIQGKVAGLQITSSDRPGGSPLIRLRGGTSLNASNEPLFVVDGVPLDNEGTSGGRNPLNFLNPNDIENITVLKDASATAIYGSRGANGVIMIETKGGSEETKRVSYNGSVSTATVADRVDVLSADQYRLLSAGLLLDGVAFPGVQERAGNASTDWQDQVTRSSVTQDHTISLSGGSEGRSYRFSLGYYRQEGIVRTSRTERVSTSLRYKELFLDDQLTLTANVKGTRTEDQFAPGGTIGNAVFYAPTQPVRDSTSQFGGFFEWPTSVLAPNNPVAEYEQLENTGQQYRSVGNAKFEYELPFVDGLTARLNLGYDVNAGENEFFAPTTLRSQAGNQNPGEVARRSFTRVNLLSDAYLEYDQTFDAIESDVKFTAGYSYQDFNEEYPEFSATGLETNILRENSTAPASMEQTFVAEIDNRLISGFGRLNYSFKNRYLLTLTVRRDGSSRFGPRNRWGTFPSAALAWRITNESFMEGLTPMISNLKLRGSWGITGNQDIGDFQYVSTFSFSNNRARVQFGDEFLPMVRPSAADPGLKWEETTQSNIGLTFGFLDERFTGNIEYYRKDTDDLIATVAAPAGTNVGDVVTTNIGELRNSGFELTLDGLVFETEDFSWNANFNAATNNSEVLQIDRASEEASEQLVGGIEGGTGNQAQILREGVPAYSFFLYEHKSCGGSPCRDGIDHNGDGTADQLDMYVDVNDDSTISRADRQVMENPFPDWTFGHSSRLRYRNVDFSFTLRAQVGNYVYNNNASNAGNLNGITNNSGIPQNRHESVLKYQFREKQLLSDVYLEDASFLKVEDITLGYTVNSIPGVKRLRVYGRVENPFVLTGYSGPRPEIGFGIDNNVFPRSRTWTTGLNLTF